MEIERGAKIKEDNIGIKVHGGDPPVASSHDPPATV
jgi:hypothetical protein